MFDLILIFPIQMDHYHHYLLHDIKNNLQKINIYLMFLNNLIN